MDLYLASPVPPFPSSVGASFGTFTTRQDVSPQPLPVVQPNQIHLGTKIMIEAVGEWATTATPTLILGFAIGTNASPSVITTVIAESGVSPAATAVAWPWKMDWCGVCTATGVSGSVVGQGGLLLGSSLTAWATIPIPITAALRTFTWNTTIERAVGVCATYSASNAANTVKVNNLSVLLLN